MCLDIEKKTLLAVLKNMLKYTGGITRCYVKN